MLAPMTDAQKLDRIEKILTTMKSNCGRLTSAEEAVLEVVNA